jgi:hypothetical protein
MACGTAIGAFVGFFETFFVFPWIDGFPLLCMVLAPVFVLGAFCLTPGLRRLWPGLAGVLRHRFGAQQPHRLQPLHLHQRLHRHGHRHVRLRRGRGDHPAAQQPLVVEPPGAGAARAGAVRHQRRLRGLGSAFESRTRDLLHQAYGLAAGKPQVQSDLMGWMFVVLEVGHAIIELRKEQAARRCTRPMPNRSPGARRSA